MISYSDSAKKLPPSTKNIIEYWSLRTQLPDVLVCSSRDRPSETDVPELRLSNSTYTRVLDGPYKDTEMEIVERTDAVCLCGPEDLSGVGVVIAIFENNALRLLFNPIGDGGMKLLGLALEWGFSKLAAQPNGEEVKRAQEDFLSRFMLRRSDDATRGLEDDEKRLRELRHDAYTLACKVYGDRKLVDTVARSMKRSLSRPVEALQALVEGRAYTRIRVKNDELYAYTRTIGIADGAWEYAYKVILNTGGDSTASALKIKREDGEERKVHPHVDSNGDLCFGSAEDEADKAFAVGNIPKLLGIVYSVLCSYNSSNAFFKVAEEVISCTNCGTSSEHADGDGCCQCGEYVCDECFVYGINEDQRYCSNRCRCRAEPDCGVCAACGDTWTDGTCNCGDYLCENCVHDDCPEKDKEEDDDQAAAAAAP